MKAFVMAAGVGSRLDPITKYIPKPLVPICNTPVMEYNISLLKKHNFKTIYANLHYFPKQIKDFFGNGEKFGVKITYSYEKNLLGTAGGVKKMAKIASLKNGENILVLSADVLTNIDLSAMIDFHKKKKSFATIALTKVKDTKEFGVVLIDKKNKIVDFEEKPKSRPISNFVNTGIYILNKEIIDLIPDTLFYDFGRQLFPLLIHKKVPFFGFYDNFYWKDVGSLKNYMQANFDTAFKKLGFEKIRNGKILHKKIFIGENSIIESPKENMNNIVIGENCKIGKSCKIKTAIIFDNVTLDKESISDVIISPHFRIFI